MPGACEFVFLDTNIATAQWYKQIESQLNFSKHEARQATFLEQIWNVWANCVLNYSTAILLQHGFIASSLYPLAWEFPASYP
jgi:hypothetical protein